MRKYTISVKMVGCDSVIVFMRMSLVLETYSEVF